MTWADDVTLEVSFGFGSGIYAASPSFVDLRNAGDVRSVEIIRGRSSVRSDFDAGICTIALDNSGGEYDPNNSGSTYAGDLKLGTPVRVRAVYAAATYTRFYGHVTRFQIEDDLPNDSTCWVEVVESSARIRGDRLQEQVLAATSTDGRIDDILDLVGWPATKRSLELGTDCAAVTFTGSAATAIAQAVEAEQGLFFVDAQGRAIFYNRAHYSAATEEQAFGGAGLPFSQLHRADDDDLLINLATITGADDDATQSSDSASIAQYGTQSYSSENPSVVDTNYADNVANWIIGKHAAINTRIDGFTVYPQKDPANMWAEVLGLELGDVVGVEYSPPAGDTLDQTVRIEQITETIVPGLWTVNYGCYPLTSIETANYWILGTGELGDTSGSTATVLA